ncbi:MAG: HopJ type III effector protein [Cocleimonas sp.]
MNTKEYLEKLEQTPELLEFSELMDVIESEYNFTPSDFKNGDLESLENENMGSCKIFSFGQLHGLTAEQTLACFGAYYRNDVLQNPDGEDHQNIRNFMQTGWNGVVFSQTALADKS